MNRRSFLLLSALVAGCLASQVPAQAATTDPLAAQLERSAAAAGIPINTEETVTLTAPGVNLATSSIRGFEQVPATDFPRGADVGYLYLDAPGSGLPAGNYKLRAHADAKDVQVGQYAGTMDLIDASGRVVRTLAADIGTSSLSVPDPLPFPRTRVSTTIDNGAGGPGGAEARIIIIHIWYHCPNGSWVHVTIIIWD